jgi:hypothetical protein
LDNKPDNIIVAGKIEANFPPDLIEKYEAASKKQASWDCKKFIAELVTIGLLFAYTSIALWQGCLNKTAIQKLSENFIKDQRPWVWPGKIYPVPPKVGEQVRADVFYVNYGKTPAIKMKSAGKVLLFVGEGILKQADTFFATFDESKVQGGSEIILPPGIPPDLKNSLGYITSRSDYPLVPKQGFSDQAVLDELNKTDGSFAVVGVVIYFDSAGTHYRSDYCMMHLSTGAMAWCEKHNEIH